MKKRLSIKSNKQSSQSVIDHETFETILKDEQEMFEAIVKEEQEMMDALVTEQEEMMDAIAAEEEQIFQALAEEQFVEADLTIVDDELLENKKNK